MNQQEALEILVNSVVTAQKRGAFELSEASLINEAVNTFLPPKEVVPIETPDITGN